MRIEQLFRFFGGVRLPHWKAWSDVAPLRAVPVPPRLCIPLQQQADDVVRPLVAVGDQVGKGQRLQDATAAHGVAVHASSSGTVTAVATRAVPGFPPRDLLCVELHTDGVDSWCPQRPPPIADPDTRSVGELLQRIADCGVTGLGGAAFPTAVKLHAGCVAGVSTLIINGIECEPCITCDDRLLRERTLEVLSGVRIARRILGASRTIIALEQGRADARDALEQALGDDDGIELALVPVIYPAGGERQLIQTLTGREVPSGKLPLDLGILCQNVGTMAAVHRAVVLGEPLISRLLTVTGPGVHTPVNLEVRIGTPMAAVIRAAGGYTETVSSLVMGGPMMGQTLPHDDFPVIATSNCLLAGDPGILPGAGAELPCIRCGACAEVCPARLLPQQLHWYGRTDDLSGLRAHHVDDCIECGACAYVCPSQIPLVPGFRRAKAALRAQDQEQQRADLSRERYLFRQQRLQREQEELAQRRQRKKDALDQTQPPQDVQSVPAIQPTQAPGATGATGAGTTADARKAAIQEAVNRAREKKRARASKQGAIEDVKAPPDE